MTEKHTNVYSKDLNYYVINYIILLYYKTISILLKLFYNIIGFSDDNQYLFQVSDLIYLSYDI